VRGSVVKGVIDIRILSVVSGELIVRAFRSASALRELEEQETFPVGPGEGASLSLDLA